MGAVDNVTEKVDCVWCGPVMIGGGLVRSLLIVEVNLGQRSGEASRSGGGKAEESAAGPYLTPIVARVTYHATLPYSTHPRASFSSSSSLSHQNVL